MFQNELPVSVKQKSKLPINVLDVWNNDKKTLKKTFKFYKESHRNQFLSFLLEYEMKYKHRALILIHDDKITITLSTKGVGAVTELDIEYSKFCDVLFKDVVM